MGVEDGTSKLESERRVSLIYAITSTQVREWVLDAAIRCARVDGGPSGGEALLLGLEDGVVLRVFVNSAFPVVLVKVSAPVVCCAMSLHRRKVNMGSDDRLSEFITNTFYSLWYSAVQCVLLFHFDHFLATRLSHWVLQRP